MTNKMSDIQLWKKIQAVPIVDDTEYQQPFCSRLANENNWNIPGTIQVIEEYRRFAYLCSLTERELTPSDAVDQAWHLHLLYTRHYWGEWTDVLGRKLHHGPSSGGEAEDERYKKNYRETLKLYRREFGMLPNPEIWPSVEERFSSNGQYVRMKKKSNGSKVYSQMIIATQVVMCAVALFLSCLIALEDNSGYIVVIMYLLLFVLHSFLFGGPYYDKVYPKYIVRKSFTVDQRWVYTLALTEEDLSREKYCWHGTVINEPDQSLEIVSFGSLAGDGGGDGGGCGGGCGG